MRILTRYILGEILSHTLIGCALFTFILFMKELPNILDMVVRNSSTFTTVMEVVLFLLPNFFMVTIPMAVLVGVLLGLSRLAGRQRNRRHAGLGYGHRLLCSRRRHRCSRRYAAGAGKFPASRSPR